jgi:SAM-dependent methyltransferase
MNVVLTEKIADCPACGGGRSGDWCQAHDRLYHSTAQQFEYRQCLDCETVYQSLRPLESEVWKCYTKEYGPHGAKQDAGRLIPLPEPVNRFLGGLASQNPQQEAFRTWLKALEKRIAQAGSILDFGCGSGKYLDKARKLGCKTVGIDFSPVALEEAGRRGHEVMGVSEDTWARLSGRRFRFVRLNHVVEHLYQPEHTLRKIHSVMDEGATIHLATPNPKGPSATKYRSAWWGLECPRHIALIPPEQMTRILRDIGFSSIEVVQEPAPKDEARSWAYTRADRGKLEGINIEKLADDGLLNLFFTWKSRVSTSRSAQADRYHLVAVK